MSAKKPIVLPNIGMSIQDQPENTTILVTNAPEEGQTLIALPHEGMLWVAYETAQDPGPNQKVFLWHPGGIYEEVKLGFNNYPVESGCAIIYQVDDCLKSSIKLGWAYV